MRILVVVDAQNDFITGSLPGHNAVAVADSIANHIALGVYGEIICTLDTHDDKYTNTQEGRKLTIPHCQIGTPGWQLYTPIEEAIYEIGAPTIMLEKNDSFGCRTLVERISSIEYPLSEIEGVTFCGFVTDICVVTNALLVKALLPEVPVRVIADLCAATSPENQIAALRVMQSCQIEVV